MKASEFLRITCRYEFTGCHTDIYTEIFPRVNRDNQILYFISIPVQRQFS